MSSQQHWRLGLLNGAITEEADLMETDIDDNAESETETEMMDDGELTESQSILPIHGLQKEQLTWDAHTEPRAVLSQADADSCSLFSFDGRSDGIQRPTILTNGSLHVFKIRERCQPCTKWRDKVKLGIGMVKIPTITPQTLFDVYAIQTDVHSDIENRGHDNTNPTSTMKNLQSETLETGCHRSSTLPNPRSSKKQSEIRDTRCHRSSTSTLPNSRTTEKQSELRDTYRYTSALPTQRSKNKPSESIETQYYGSSKLPKPRHTNQHSSPIDTCYTSTLPIQRSTNKPSEFVETQCYGSSTLPNPKNTTKQPEPIDTYRYTSTLPNQRIIKRHREPTNRQCQFEPRLTKQDLFEMYAIKEDRFIRMPSAESSSTPKTACNDSYNVSGNASLSSIGFSQSVQLRPKTDSRSRPTAVRSLSSSFSGRSMVSMDPSGGLDVTDSPRRLIQRKRPSSERMVTEKLRFTDSPLKHVSPTRKEDLPFYKRLIRSISIPKLIFS